jgi:hypothetical protein
MAKTRYKSPRTAMSSVKPSDAAVTEVTSLLACPGAATESAATLRLAVASGVPSQYPYVLLTGAHPSGVIPLRQPRQH